MTKMGKIRITAGPLIAFNAILWKIPLWFGREGRYGAMVKLWQIIEDNGQLRPVVTLTGTNAKQVSIVYGGHLDEV